ncbi:MAG: EAL domain-containing protein [Sporomusaceae bacterium]|nr:EAL domain-containing protein [Sporomusaceae bacterium]
MTWHKLLRFSEILSRQRHLAALRRGMLINIPVTVIGSLAVMLNHLPYAAYQQQMRLWFGSDWQLAGQCIVNASLAVMSLLLTVTASYSLAREHRLSREAATRPLLAALVSLCCLMVWAQPFGVDAAAGLSFAWLGLNGILLAAVTALLATELFLFFAGSGICGRQLLADAADPILPQSLAAILPAALTLLLFLLVRLAAGATAIAGIHEWAYSQLLQAFTAIDSPFAQLLAFSFFVHLFWLLGLHGNNILQPLLDRLDVTAVHAAAADSGVALTKTFLDNFALIGGAGSTLCLILALLLTSRRRDMTRLAKLSLLPGIFHINEILLFGLPVILNPFYLIPFLLAPFVFVLTAYLAVAGGLAAPVTTAVNWTTPPLLNAYLATGSWSGVALQSVNLLLGTLIYLPFVRWSERQQEEAAQRTYSALLREAECSHCQPATRFLSRQDAIGNLARVLCDDLRQALDRGELLLEYQPQVNDQGRVIGVEALLRWPHNHYGRIPPTLTIALAEEAGLIPAVGLWVLREACRQRKSWQDDGISGLRMAVNVSALQLAQGTLPAAVTEALHSYPFDPRELELELTETLMLNNDGPTRQTLQQLRQLGVRVAIDDFGMGHTSLRYLKEFQVQTLKIDALLSRDVLHDKNCQEIIHSIASLCASLGIETLVEHVETEAQRQKLVQLGCRQYQGYLYSPALPPAEAADYIRQRNR